MRCAGCGRHFGELAQVQLTTEGDGVCFPVCPTPQGEGLGDGQLEQLDDLAVALREDVEAAINLIAVEIAPDLPEQAAQLLRRKVLA